MLRTARLLDLLVPFLLLPAAPAWGAPQAARSGAQRFALRTPVPVRPPNLLLVIVDDFGVDLAGAYGEAADPPCTPTIDGLAADGVLFRNAWTNPVCSPTRAALFTGRYGFRTGIGGVITSEAGLSLDELTLPEALAGHDSALVGKWHLAGSLGDLHPNDSGFPHFSGIVGGGVPSYFQYQKVIDGQRFQSSTYATTDITEDALAWLGVARDPWFLCVSYNAPHTPLHEPPAELCPAACPTGFCAGLPASPSNRQLGKAMVEALDTELGRLLAAVDAAHPDTLVVLIGDNGTARTLTEAPFLPGHAKGTLYEGGVNVPLIVRGPGVVAGAECAALVSSTDLFATFAELAGSGATADDSVSLVPYLSAPDLPSLRATVYTETFSPNGGQPPYTDHARAIRGERYKLIRAEGRADELYDLALDPFETANLLPGPTAEEQAAYDALVAGLAALGVD